MKRLLALVLFCAALPATCPQAALASTYTVPAFTGASIQSTMNTAAAAGSGNTVYLPAGNYTLSSAITVPCASNLTVTGPVAAPATAVLNPTFSGNYLFNMSSCSGVTIEYLLFQGNSGNGGIYVGSSNSSNITIVHNGFTGLPSDTEGDGSSGVYLDGNINSTDSNITISYNSIGDSTSCTAIINGADNNGTCSGIATYVGDLENLTIEHNYIFHVSEGIHINQICTGCSGSSLVSIMNSSHLDYNYILNYHRIGMEIQNSVTTVADDYSHNAVVYPITPFYGTFAMSMACCLSGRNYNTSGLNPGDFVNDNVLITNAATDPPFGIEWWGLGAQGNYDLVEGTFSNGITIGYGFAPWEIQNTYICQTVVANGGYMSNEEGVTPPNYPTGYNGTTNSCPSPNVCTATCAQRASTAPTISPAAGNYTSPPTVTLSDSGLNTSIYYTVDGSAPVPGSGTTQLYTAPFLITLPATVKAVGMWGVAPQPLSWAAPYGYTPSAVQSAAYTSSGGVTLSSVSLTNTGAVHTLAAGASLQMTANCLYSNGATTNCTIADVYGNSVSNWISSNTAALSISAGGLMTGVAAGTANVTAVIAGMTTPAWAMTVSSATLALNSVALSSTGGISSLAPGAVNQLLATCTYADSSTTNCATADSHGNVVNPWTSSAPSIATVNSTGAVTGVAGGSTNLTATVSPSMVTSQWGQTGYSVAGTTNSGYINSDYFVFGTQAGGYAGTGGTCSFYLPNGTLTDGSLFDCGLILAPTPTTQASSWLCWWTYTVSSTSAPGAFVSGTMNNCGTIAPGTAAWVAVATNSPGTPGVGFDNCGGSCNGAAPTLGNGTYPYYCITNTYGARTGLGTAMLACGTGSHTQVSQFVTMGQPPIVSNAVPLTVTAAPPTLSSAYLVTAGSANTMIVGGTLQFSARCVYSDGSTTDCTVADVHGNAVTTWTTNNPALVTIGAVGSANPGLATAIAAGTATIQANVGSVVAPAFSLTISAPTVNLTGISIATTGGVTGLFLGQTNQLIATCLYSDGSTTDCTTTDSHGNVASAYNSTAPAHATVNATSGLVTAVGLGTTTLTATAGSFTSAAIPLTVLAVPSGVYTITISGPVTFSGTVHF